MLKRIVTDILIALCMLGGLYAFGLFYNLCWDHPIILILVICIEATIFIPWEIKSRENYREYYEKGGNRT